MAMGKFRRISGFVPQSDVLFPRLTVRETLMFSASLRLPVSESAMEKAARVTTLISELGLMHVADATVGGEDIRGVSGGERRRVSIGVDVIHDPAVLLLDEPTSGLDSASALHVIHMLHSMAKLRSRTIILSIHQPGYRIIQQISNFLLLANGAVVHHGSLHALQTHLVADGHTIPPQLNILDYALEAISANSLFACPLSANNTNMPLSANASSEHLHTCSMLAEAGNEAADAEGASGVCPHTSWMDVFIQLTLHVQRDTDKPCFANSSGKEILILSRRFSMNLLRARKLVMSKMLQALGAGIGLGSIYTNVGMNEQGVKQRLGFFAFTLTFLMTASVEALPIFLEERHVLERETSRGAYRVFSHVVANLLVFSPFLLLIALLYSLPAYYLIGLSSAPSACFLFVFIVWCVLVVANSFVAFCSALAPDFVMANSLIQGCMGAFFLFSGYLIDDESMPSYWRFMHYVSIFKYPLEGLLINEYSSLQLQGKCFNSTSPKVNFATYNLTCDLPPSAVLQQLRLGVHRTHLWNNVAVLILFLSSYRLLCYVVLRIKVSKRSR